MWDRHWCRGATRRVNEMAGRMNELVGALRSRGVPIVHCPSDTMTFYADHPGRALALSAPAVDVGDTGRAKAIAAEAGALPIDDHDGGCACTPKCRGGHPWTRQHPAIEIAAGDAIGDRAEVFN